MNGSFVTDIMEPNDVDCVLLFARRRRRNRLAIRELRSGLPFLEIAIVDEDEFHYLVDGWFASDRFYKPKGMIEVIA